MAKEPTLQTDRQRPQCASLQVQGTLAVVSANARQTKPRALCSIRTTLLGIRAGERKGSPVTPGDWVREHLSSCTAPDSRPDIGHGIACRTDAPARDLPSTLLRHPARRALSSFRIRHLRTSRFTP